MSECECVHASHEMNGDRNENGSRRKRRGVKASGRKFQKCVIQTLLQKDDANTDESEDIPFQPPQFVGTNLDLSKKKLKTFPSELLTRAGYVQYLYLEGNKLTELPETFFQSLTHMQWFDIRNNDLVALPTRGLASHSCLEYLLLQGNRIKHLPTELGVISTLKGLQLAGNPVVNVPYDVIADGFHSIVAHLKKLNSQENILLPSSDVIVVRSTKDDVNESNTVVEESPSKRLSYPMNPRVWDAMSQDPPKKVLSRSKPCSKPKTRVSTIPSHRQVVSRRRTRIGYRRKMITPEMIEERAKKDFQLAKKRETLEKQARKIQRLKDRETLKTWRRKAHANLDQVRLLDNYQQYPSRNFLSATPFDVDPEFLNMLNRIDLYRSLKEVEATQRKRRRGPQKLYLTINELEKQMRDISEKLQKLNVSNSNPVSPRKKQIHLCNKISQMKEIQKTLRNLQLQNTSIAGVGVPPTSGELNNKDV